MHLKNVLLSLIGLCCGLTTLAQSTQWYNPMDEPIPVIHNQAWSAELKGSYHRMPDRMEKAIMEQTERKFWALTKNSAGEKLVFRTNSKKVSVRYVTESKNFSMKHMPATGVSGVDLYAVDQNGKWTSCNPKFSYWYGDTCGVNYFVDYVETTEENGYEFHLYLPLYNGVEYLKIGVDEGSTMRFEPPTQEKPIVIYGTSIAQGACASRPGNAWTNIVDRLLEHPVINLGFSGSAKMDPVMQGFIDEIDAQMYILDNMENMLAKNVYESSLQCCRLLRKDHPDVPILLMEHSGWPDRDVNLASRNESDSINIELRRVYDTLIGEGMSGLYYMTREEIGLDTECFVEGIHPNDYGMMIQGKSTAKKIQEILGEHASALFTPVRQNRDPYNWRGRHEDVLALNAAEKPDIVMIGNSITHYFGGEPKAHLIRGQKSWESLTKGLKVHNLGFGWDRIENGLWRIYHGELDGYEARKVFLLLGTNNVVKNTDEEIVSGILELVQAVREHQPKAKIYVCGIMPRHGWGPRVLGVNSLLEKAIKAQPNLTFVDFSPLGDSEGVLLEPYREDGTHPNAEGYAAEAKILKKYFKE